LDGGGRRTWRSLLPRARRSQHIAGLSGGLVVLLVIAISMIINNADGDSSDSASTGGSAHAARIRAVAFSPNGKTLASAGDSGAIQLSNRATGQPIGQPITGSFGSVASLAFSPDGRLLASAGDDRAVRL
jgi:WD40 repeat protein